MIGEPDDEREPDRAYGCVGIVVDAKTDALDFYAKHGFVAIELVEGQSHARPSPTPMFFSMRVVKDSSGAG